jgi:4-amino-4-deoxy-L-arabinose transferase-like glycosyltransferase
MILSDSIPRRWAPVWLAALTVLLLAPGSATLPLIDRDEPRFAGATLEMMERGEWVVPYFNGVYRFDKPVLTYWLMRAGYALAGRGEFGARLHSMVCAFFVAWAVHAIGRRRFGDAAGFRAGVFTLFTAQMIVHGRSAVADLPLLLFVTLAQGALWALLGPGAARPTPARGAALGAFLGMGFLAKGPLAIAIPALTLLLYRFAFWRRPLSWRVRDAGRLAGAAVLAFVAVVAPWGLLALVRTRGAFWQVGIGRHVVDRGLAAFDGRPFVPFYYIPSSFFSLFPWIAFAGAAFAALRRRWSSDGAFLAAWFLAPYLIFSFYSTQLPHYVLPAFPAFALILAQAFETPSAEWPRWARVFSVAVLGLAAAVAIVPAAAGAALSGRPEWAPLRSALFGVSALVAWLTAMGLLATARRGLAWRALAAAPLLGLAVWQTGGALRGVTPAIEIARLTAPLPPETVFWCCRFREPSLVFYTGRRWSEGSPEEAARDASGPRPFFAVVTEREVRAGDFLAWFAATATGRPATLRARDYAAENAALPRGNIVGIVEGWNVARSAWVRLAVIHRPAPEREAGAAP